MGRHLRNQFRHSYRTGCVDIDGYLTVVAGSPTTMAVTDCPGVASVARTAAGLYTITLDNPALDVIWRGGTHLASSGAIGVVVPATLAPATRRTEAVAGTFKIACRTPATGADVELTATDQVHVSFTLVISAAGQR